MCSTRGDTACGALSTGCNALSLHGIRDTVYHLTEEVCVIVSFGDRGVEDLYHGRFSSRSRRIPREIASLVLFKLDMLNSAAALRDLKSPPGNRLEALRGDLHGFHSIRVNDQWRIVFRWMNNSAHEVRLMDYHK